MNLTESQVKRLKPLLVKLVNEVKMELKEREIDMQSVFRITGRLKNVLENETDKISPDERKKVYELLIGFLQSSTK